MSETKELCKIRESIFHRLSESPDINSHRPSFDSAQINRENCKQAGRGVVLYYDGGTPFEERQKIVQFLNDNDVPCREVDISNNFEQLSYIQAKSHGLFALPIVFMNNKMVGNYSEVYNDIKRIKQTCAQNLIFSCTEEDFKSLNQVSENIPSSIIDRALDLSESILSYLNPFSYFGSYANAKQTNAINFIVLRSNWYTRSQKRIISFTESGVARLNPETLERRGFFFYHQVRELAVDNTNGKIVVILCSKQKEYWTATPRAISFIVAFFIDKCGCELKISKI